MRKKITTLCFLLGSMVSVSVSATDKPDDKSPLGCKNVGYKYELKTLELHPAEAGDKQSLYFIFNALNQPINLYQMLKNDSTRSMYLNHTVRSREWAVLSTSETELKYICTIDDPKQSYGKIVDCSDSIKVCEYARVKYGLNNKGNYWLVNSNTSSGAVNEVLHYGIIPK
jgi:hypothetical protein